MIRVFVRATFSMAWKTAALVEPSKALVASSRIRNWGLWYRERASQANCMDRYIRTVHHLLPSVGSSRLVAKCLW